MAYTRFDVPFNYNSSYTNCANSVDSVNTENPYVTILFQYLMRVYVALTDSQKELCIRFGLNVIIVFLFIMYHFMGKKPQEKTQFENQNEILTIVSPTPKKDNKFSLSASVFQHMTILSQSFDDPTAINSVQHLFSEDELVILEENLKRMAHYVLLPLSDKNQFFKFITKLKTSLVGVTAGDDTIYFAKSSPELEANINNNDVQNNVKDKIDALVDWYNHITTTTNLRCSPFELHYRKGYVCDAVINLVEQQDAVKIFKTHFNRSYAWACKYSKMYIFVHKHPILLKSTISWNELSKNFNSLVSTLESDTELNKLLNAGNSYIETSDSDEE